jgi:plastocyanin
VAGTDPPPGASCDGDAPNVVRIRDFAFTGTQLTVAPGTTVTWVNCDAVAHTSTADAGGWDSGILVPGASFSRAFPAAGSFAYHCDPHPGMRGTIIVR